MEPATHAEGGSEHTTKSTEEPSNPLSHQHADEVDENASEPEPSDIYVKTPRLRPWRNKRKRKMNQGRENHAYWDNLRRKRAKVPNNASTPPPVDRILSQNQRNMNHFTTQSPFQTLAHTSQDLGGKMHDKTITSAQLQGREFQSQINQDNQQFELESTSLSHKQRQKLNHLKMRAAWRERKRLAGMGTDGVPRKHDLKRRT